MRNATELAIAVPCDVLRQAADTLAEKGLIRALTPNPWIKRLFRLRTIEASM
jgi:hypothetical protein